MSSRVSVRGLVALLVVVGGAWRSASADTLAMKDGRFFEGDKIERTETGYRIHLKHGKLEVKEDLVQGFFKTNADGSWVPQTDDEKAKAEKGLAPWRGKWIKANRRKRYADKEVAARELRMKQQQERRLWVNHAVVKTKRFEFHHTLPDELFEQFQALFETYYKVFTKEWKIRPSKDFGKAVINIYHDEEYFHQVSGARQGVVGYYVPSERDLHFFYDRDRHRFTIDVMFHEGNHMLTHMINERVWYPAWINEGLAEYYGASEWDAETKTMTTGGIQSGRLCVLWNKIKKNEWQGLEELIRTPRIDATQYAWAWSLCHFLLTNPRYAKGFKKYFMALGKSKAVKRKPLAWGLLHIEPDEQITHLKKFLKIKSVDELEAEWYHYIKTALAIDNVELDYAGAGWIMMIYGKDKSARKFFKQAIDKGDAGSFVYYSMASLLLNRRNKADEAAGYAQKAIELDPLHARSWFVLARCYEKMGKEQMAEAERLFHLAAELDPDDERIWLHMAWREDIEKEQGK